MSFADHIRADVEEYDALIRTFVPHYETLLSTLAGVVDRLAPPEPTIVDLGTGTGALAERCLEVRPGARVRAVDADPEMLQLAEVRLVERGRVELVEGDFLEVELPACDAVVACLAFHHVPTGTEKRALYRACADALGPGGFLATADRFTARDPTLAEAERDAWLAHLGRTYTPEESEEHLASWADEDFYFPLLDEVAWIEAAGLAPEVVWRAAGNAVVVGKKAGGG